MCLIYVSGACLHLCVWALVLCMHLWNTYVCALCVCMYGCVGVRVCVICLMYTSMECMDLCVLVCVHAHSLHLYVSLCVCIAL